MWQYIAIIAAFSSFRYNAHKVVGTYRLRLTNTQTHSPIHLRTDTPENEMRPAPKLFGGGDKKDMTTAILTKYISFFL